MACFADIARDNDVYKKLTGSQSKTETKTVQIQNSMYWQQYSSVNTSAGLMPTEAGGNYLPEPPYLRETKTYHSQPLESIRHGHAGNYFVPLSIRPIFIFVVAEVMSNYLTTDGLRKFTSGGPLEA